MSEIKRYDWLDMAKGIGIVLVVMGHTLFPLHSAIDVFHMPMFFILAGFTLKAAKIDDFLLKKVDSIVIPYIFFSIVSVPISYVVPHESIFNGPLWFLQTLFVALIIGQLIIKFTEKIRAHVVMGGAILLVAIYTWFSLKYNAQFLPFNIDRALRALPFVLFGYIIKDSVLIENSKKRNIVLFLTSLLLYGLAFSAYYVLFHPKGTFKMGEIMRPNLPLFYISSLGGAFAIFALCKFVKRIMVINWLGRNSLVVMCVHFPLAEYLNTFVSKTPFYINGGFVSKAIISIIIVTICLLFGSTCSLICHKYLPHLTGYKRNFKI